MPADGRCWAGTIEQPSEGGDQMKRAISLAGGGPAAGLHIGALKKLAEANINFDVWALSCIGAWVGIVYHQFDGNEVEKADQTYEAFKLIFRDDASYRLFPVNTVFPPSPISNTLSAIEFFSNPDNYRDLVLPHAIVEALTDTYHFLSNPQRWNEGDFNGWLFRGLSVNPIMRLFTAMLWKAGRNGLTALYQPEASFLRSLNFDRLYRDDRPFIYHNAWNLTKSRIEQFANKPRVGYNKLDARTLCACSALPFIEETIVIGEDTFCEGALVHTMNFERLLEDHPDLDEVWIVRIVDRSQVRPPKTLHQSLENAYMLFAASLGQANVELFRYHARELGWRGRIIELPVSPKVNFDWNHGNLDLGVSEGYAAATAVFAK
jgi:predicted acylesterase/phospholipase RssA